VSAVRFLRNSQTPLGGILGKGGLLLLSSPI
jgi:hypothetical protein